MPTEFVLVEPEITSASSIAKSKKISQFGVTFGIT